MLTANANENDVTKLITTRKLRVLLLDDDKFTLEFVGESPRVSWRLFGLSNSSRIRVG
jgi:hypothetical protein